MTDEGDGLALVLGGLDDDDSVGTPKLSREESGAKAAEHACARRVRRVLTAEDPSDDELVSALRDAFSILTKK